MAVGIQMVILPFSKAGASHPHAGNTCFGVPEHHGNGSALPTLDQSGNLSLDLMQGDLALPKSVESDYLSHGKAIIRSSGREDFYARVCTRHSCCGSLCLSLFNVLTGC
jgi:hypothetical protein